MIVKYHGKTNPLELINGKTYDVVSIEGDWYRILDETGEDYLYPPEVFEIIAPNDGSVPVYTFDEAADLDLSAVLEQFRERKAPQE